MTCHRCGVELTESNHSVRPHWCLCDACAGAFVEASLNAGVNPREIAEVHHAMQMERAMRITTINEARALVGRTFERDGKRRTISRVSASQDGARCLVMWADDDGGGARRLSEFADWIGNATEVHE